ncbi:phage tail assembly chaperone [Pseudomonas chlororaphis subsp. piscium]|nr:phage tail assembly chaperone [Pseudomonas chlororaphis subsp. piscium]
MLFYSPTTSGFYDSEENKFIPGDVVEITDQEHVSFLEGVAKGMRVVASSDGFPVLAEPLPLSHELLCEGERSWRSMQLTATDGVVTRHRDELEEGSETTLTPAQYGELQTYRRTLRDWPENGEFPLAEHRPVAPPWLADQLQ